MFLISVLLNSATVVYTLGHRSPLPDQLPSDMVADVVILILERGALYKEFNDEKPKTNPIINIIEKVNINNENKL